MECEAGITRRVLPDSKPKTIVTYGLSRAAKMAFKRMETVELEDLLDLVDKSDKEMQTATGELRTRYRLNMMNNAQLDNEKQALTYQVEDLQDELDYRTANKGRLENELKTWSKSVEEERRQQVILDDEIERLREMISDRDDVIKECGYRIVNSGSDDHRPLISNDCIPRLGLTNQTSVGLGEKLQDLLSENTSLNTQLKQSKLDLQAEREGNLYSRQMSRQQLRSPTMIDVARLEREQCQKVADCKREMNNVHLKIDSLENQLLRLEAQIHRYREICEESEKTQTQVKADNRRTSKQLEELRKRADELKLENGHLETRLDRVRRVRENAFS